jgi:transposase
MFQLWSSKRFSYERLRQRLYQNHWLTVRDLPLGENSVYLKINRRQFKCLNCGKNFSEEFELVKCLKSWGAEVLNQIEEVSIDMYKPYKSLAMEILPEAEIVADRFHVMGQINDELDREIRSNPPRSIETQNKLSLSKLN